MLSAAKHLLFSLNTDKQPIPRGLPSTLLTLLLTLTVRGCSPSLSEAEVSIPEPRRREGPSRVEASGVVSKVEPSR
jgi:hypothetical protein